MKEAIKKLYPAEQWEIQQQRYAKGIEKFKSLFGGKEPIIISAPGRSEICGNHTDHNLGKAIGAAIDLDLLLFVSPATNGVIQIHSEGYSPFKVDTANLSFKQDELGTSPALVRGICFKMKELGHTVGGFNAFITSNVCNGSGLSSSAAFEVGIVAALDHLYNKGTMPAKEMAVISQFAENEYMGKDSGLLDQLSCAYGGLIAIDFCEAKNPEVSPIPFDFEKTNHRLIVTDVRSDHSDLTADYVAIKSEMQEIASFFNKKVLREISLAEFEIALPQLHKIVSERALIRAYHFFFENQRVDSAKEALIKGDFEAFKRIVTASGQSSFNYLQNIYSAQNPTAQASALALCIAQKLLDKCGAWRVHGGGFGGTIQAYVPEEKVEDYCAEMDRIFGKNCCFVLKIRNCGPIKIQ